MTGHQRLSKQIIDTERKTTAPQSVLAVSIPTQAHQ